MASSTPKVRTKRVRWEDMHHLPENPIQESRLVRVESKGGFNPEFVGTPELALNDYPAFPDLPADALILIDGHHRKALFERANGNRGSDDVICRISEGLTREQVEQRWLAVQDTRTHHVNELFVHRVAAGEGKAKIMDKIVTDAGYRIPAYQPSARVKNAIRGANAVEWVYNGGTANEYKTVFAWALNRTLQGLQFMYPDDAGATKSNMIKGLGVFHLRYGDAIDLERLHKHLPAKYAKADKVLAAAENVNEGLGFPVPDSVGYIIRLAYNSKRGSKADLPEWR
jgi:hypothetical protein